VQRAQTRENNKKFMKTEEYTRYRSNYYNKNRARILEKQRIFRQDNKEYEKERHAKYYSDNKEKKRRWGIQYRAKNKERIARRTFEYRERTKDMRRQRFRQYYKDNREEILSKQAQYYQKDKAQNPEKYRKKGRATSHRRRARESCVPSTLTEIEWQETLEGTDYKCVYCGAPWEHQEHFVPLSKGGGYTALNIVPSCAKCNRKKGTMMPFDFIRERMWYNVLKGVQE
jgi:5-methylcytosine-specific restriction endonuclease McrA